jgi:uncharacterized membrane protein YsdA (DUF1294 family)/cold shock CspA family protein
MTKRYRGRITSWKDDRGFGFITPSSSGDQIFVHISSIVNVGRRPLENEIVTYSVNVDSSGRLQAERVSLRSNWYLVSPPFWLAAGFLLLISGMVLAGRLPFLVLSLYCIASLVTFLVYAGDKAAARRNEWRTAESTLLLLGLCGGWPGALIAQHVFRHKTRKASFVQAFRVTVVVNCGILALASHPGSGQFFLSLLALINC